MKRYCIGCTTELRQWLDNDPNGDAVCKCARCCAEEEHDFDLEPLITFNRDGSRTNENIFSHTPMVRFTVNFPNVDEETRRKLHDVKYNLFMTRHDICLQHGSGGPNGYTTYVTEEGAKLLSAALMEAGLPEED